MKKIAVIGSGFSGLSAAAYTAKAGYEVHVYEKHEGPGGRARQFRTPEGFVFDMGPSWYWMPDIVDAFFADFNTRTADHFDLVSLDPQFEMVFADGRLDLPRRREDMKELFELLEPGAGMALDRFMELSKHKYEVSMKSFVGKPFRTWSELLNPSMLRHAFRMDLLTNFRAYVSRFFHHPHLRALMEFPVIFLGASPKDIPALYSLMNYGGYGLGTHYPAGGFYRLVLAMMDVAEKAGATFHFDHNVDRIITANGKVQGLSIAGKTHEFDAVIASSDYHHTETLLENGHRNYTEKYWAKKTFAPSSLIFYLGFNERIPNLRHHTLFFEHDLDQHLDCIYGNKRWPEKPLFYSCCPSKTDESVAPKHGENLFLLVPIATGIDDDEDIREGYLRDMIARVEKHTGAHGLMSKIAYKRSYCVRDFINDYNAYEGNAYGLANTLTQTAVLKPKMKNRKLYNLFYTGQLTVPGPVVPPSIISGKIAANELNSMIQPQ